MFPGSSSVTSSCVTPLKPAPQTKAPGQENRPFPQRLGACFSLLCVQCPGEDSLSSTLSLFQTLQSFLATRARCPRGISCVGCMCLLAVAEQATLWCTGTGCAVSLAGMASYSWDVPSKVLPQELVGWECGACKNGAQKHCHPQDRRMQKWCLPAPSSL